MQTSLRRVTGKQKHRQIYLKYIELIRLLFTYFSKEEKHALPFKFCIFFYYRDLALKEINTAQVAKTAKLT